MRAKKGTPEGELATQRWRETMQQKAGDPATYMRTIAAEGGRRGHTGGFYANRELARIAGMKGGRIARKRKNEVSN